MTYNIIDLYFVKVYLTFFSIKLNIYVAYYFLILSANYIDYYFGVEKKSLIDKLLKKNLKKLENFK